MGSVWGWCEQGAARHQLVCQQLYSRACFVRRASSEFSTGSVCVWRGGGASHTVHAGGSCVRQNIALRRVCVRKQVGVLLLATTFQLVLACQHTSSRVASFPNTALTMSGCASATP